MRIRLKRAVVVISATAILLGLLLCPGLPWSKRNRHTVSKTLIRGEITLASWRGKNPRLASITGRVNTPGVQIQVLDSRSGWAALADKDGKFIVRDVMWYPQARFELAISADERSANLLTIHGPDVLPSTDSFDADLLQYSGESENLRSLIGVNSITEEDFDTDNLDYYRTVFAKVTEGKDSAEKQIIAINDFVSAKLNYQEPARSGETPRAVLERGSQFCGALAKAMRSLLYAGGYRSRAVNIIDAKSSPGTHVVVEVDYDGGWHLFDPTYGLVFRLADGRVASYRDVRLNGELITGDLLEKFEPSNRAQILDLLRGAYATGCHHFYYFKGEI